MNQHVETPVTEAPAIGISLQHQLPGRANSTEARSLVFQTYVPFFASEAEINGALDKIVKASERQQAKVELPMLRDKARHLRKFIARATEDMDRLDSQAALLRNGWVQQHQASGRRGEFKPSASQQTELNNSRTQRDNAKTTLERALEDLADCEAEIAQLEKVIAGE